MRETAPKPERYRGVTGDLASIVDSGGRAVAEAGGIAGMGVLVPLCHMANLTAPFVSNNACPRLLTLRKSAAVGGPTALT